MYVTARWELVVSHIPQVVLFKPGALVSMPLNVVVVDNRNLLVVKLRVVVLVCMGEKMFPTGAAEGGGVHSIKTEG